MQKKYSKELEEILYNTVITKRDIFLDGDDTALDFFPLVIEKLNNRYKDNPIDLELEDVNFYNLENIPKLQKVGMSEYELLAELREMGNSYEFEHINVKNGCIKFFDILLGERTTGQEINGGKNSSGYHEQIKIFTSREKYYTNARTKTINTFKNIKFPVAEHNIILTDNKVETSKKYRPGFAVEDALHHTINYGAASIPTIVITMPWNNITLKDLQLRKDKQMYLLSTINELQLIQNGNAYYTGDLKEILKKNTQLKKERTITEKYLEELEKKRKLLVELGLLEKNNLAFRIDNDWKILHQYAKNVRNRIDKYKI